MKAVVAVLLVCSLVHSGYAAVILAPYQEANCTQIEVHGNNLQEVLINVSLTEPSDACFQVAIAPGNYTISQVLIISQNISLQGVGDVVGISFNVTKPVDSQASQPFYVMQFLNASFAAFTNIHFTSSPGIIGFENVTEVRITNCTFSYFIQGAVDMYGCSYPTITNSTFRHNGPATVIKPQPYRGHSAGLSIAFYFSTSLGYNPRAVISGCWFINNSAISSITAAQSAVFSQQRTFVLRGGAVALVINTPDSVEATIMDCVFVDNAASVNGGAIYIQENGLSNHNVLISGTSFIRNIAYVSAGGVYVRFATAGSLEMLNSVLLYDSIFTGNSAPIGGAVSLYANIVPPANGEIGDYGCFRNCSFQNNSATDFGAAIAVSSALVLSNREMFTPTDIINCTFVGNEISNSGGGVIGAAYIQVILNGTNKFSRNSGASILLVGSVMRVGGSLQMINNTNSGHGGTLYVLSHGQIILYDNVQVTFDGNNGSSGASIVTESAIPSIFHQLINNRLCFLQHPTVASLPSQLAKRNVSVLFKNNNAPVGSAIYMENAPTCTFQSNITPTFAAYINNMNSAHQGDEYNTQWDIQTPSAEAQVQNESLFVSTYAGAQVRIYMAVYDELEKPVSAVFRLLDITEQKTSTQSEANNPYQFQRGLILYNNLHQGAFDTAFLVPNRASGQRTIQISTLEQTYKYQRTFKVDLLPCPLGTVLTVQRDVLYSCRCNSLNPSIAECNNTIIVFPIYRGGIWGGEGSSPNEYGDNLVTYACPMGYCQCCVEDQGAIVICLFSVNSMDLNSQCANNRKGILCGNCIEGLGVSALLNECVTCGDASGLLIAGLVIANVIAIIMLITVGIWLPSWLHPCIFYIQVLPHITVNFPVPFNYVHHYLYYVSSGLSFYFVYDFCLYPNMSPLVSYFIRYLPLFTAIIICPIILAIRHKKHPHAPWHGLWWIVVLMYTHVVHTSMSILNCPRLPGSNGNTANVWYINGNIQCFTGWHIPLAILAILILILCVAAIVPLFCIKMLPRRLQCHIQNITPAVIIGYRDEVKWFGSMDLLRRIIMVLLIVVVPGDEYSSIFVIIVILSIYGYIQPYKHMLSNVLEVVLAVDVLVMLMMKNTNQIRDSLIGIPPQLANTTTNNKNSTCIDAENISGLSPLVILLTPFYYLPLVIAVIGGVVWTAHQACLYVKLRRTINESYVNEGIEDKKYILLHDLASRNTQHSTLPLSTPYVLVDDPY